MNNRRNYYRLLHVEPDAPPEVIHASYRTLMQRMHPDRGGSHAAAVLINEAYATLSDPRRRAMYDRTLARAAAARRLAAEAAAAADRAPARSAAEPTQASGPQATAAPSRAADPAAGSGPGAARPSAAACAFCAAAIAALHVDDPEAACARCGSVLLAARHHRDTDAARRAIARVPKTMAVQFRVARAADAGHVGTTEDVSLNGMRLLTSVALSAGDRVRLDCSFCSAVAVVKSAARGQARGQRGWLCGLEFLTLRIKHERGGLISTVA